MCVDRKLNRDWWCVDYFSSNFAQNVKKKQKKTPLFLLILDVVFVLIENNVSYQ